MASTLSLFLHGLSFFNRKKSPGGRIRRKNMDYSEEVWPCQQWTIPANCEQITSTPLLFCCLQGSQRVVKFLARVTIIAVSAFGLHTLQGGAQPNQKDQAPTRGPLVAIAVMVDYEEVAAVEAEVAAYLAAVEAERIEHERQVAEWVAGVQAAEAAQMQQQQRSIPRVQVVQNFSGGTNSHLERIKQCESGGNYAIKTNPIYRGAYQFSYSTWAAMGGSGDPADASPAEQDMRAQMLYDQAGPGQWPVCQYR